MIDETARVHPDAEIGEEVRIGAWSVVGPGVRIGAGTTMGENVVIRKNTLIGEGNRIFQHTSIGEEPQWRGLSDPDTHLEIGDGNVIREFVTIHRGSPKGGGVTRIGDDNYIMAYVHVAHDCRIGDHTTLINNTSLAGHVTVDDHATLGGFTAVHQFCHIGAYSYVSRFARLGMDVLPYLMVCGTATEIAKTFGLNREGLRRSGFDRETITILTRAYKAIFREGLLLEEAVGKLEGMLEECPEVRLFLEGIARAERGFVR